jgi:hypothetical protein
LSLTKASRPDLPATSEKLIAKALKDGTLTYEESLRQRTLPLYVDLRLQERFRSPVMNWKPV